MFYATAFGLVFVVVVLAGQSMRRKGRWTAAAYRNWVIAVGLLCALGILLGWYADHRSPRLGAGRDPVVGGLTIAEADKGSLL